MTREEAKKALEKVKMHFVQIGRFSDDTRIEACEALNMAIEALSVKTGGDLISRQAAINAIARDIPFITFTEDPKRTAQRIIGTVPSAEPKTGMWIFHPKDAIESMFTKPKCSECGFESSDGGNFCSNCGADMRKGGAE